MINDFTASRLQKILSAHGLASRREAETMIRDGRVSVNGVIAVIGQSATPGCDEILVDGVPLEQKSELVYIMLNKPLGYVTTMSDEHGRSTVRELVADVAERIYPVGRLDYDSEGLLLMTNDGEFANMIAHPSYGIEKTYIAIVQGNATDAEALLKNPIEIDGHIVKAVSVTLSGGSSHGGGVFNITIKEGRNRQVRKMLAKFGLEVTSLKRVSIGSLELGSLNVGQWRHLTSGELSSLRSKIAIRGECNLESVRD